MFRPQSSDHSHQKLLIGTHTSNDEQNYLQIMKVKIPLESSKDTRDQPERVRPPVVAPEMTAQIGQPQPVKHEKISVETQINHAGEVNKARYMP